jgi:glyoxylase-like metal-dependent hydrolase (beta-lactamase superfamily II)
VAALKLRFCDEFDGGFGWIVDEFMQRCSHAIVEDGRVWVIDPVDGDGVEDRIRAAGTPAGVIQLLDRHNRDCAALAARLGVRHHVVPQGSLGPFACIAVKDSRSWNEIALWWPDRRVLVSADVLGTAPYFRAAKERLAVHPLLRLRPPREQLGALQPDAILCGHGEGVSQNADAALREALGTSRRRIPGQVVNALRAWRASRPSRASRAGVR